MDEFAQKRLHEKKIIFEMISIYCHGNHGTKNTLCPKCQLLLNYVNSRIDNCPFMKTKTFCSQCRIHCYSPEKQLQIRKVMRYSGPRMLLHHPVLTLSHAFITMKQKCKNKNLKT